MDEPELHPHLAVYDVKHLLIYHHMAPITHSPNDQCGDHFIREREVVKAGVVVEKSEGGSQNRSSRNGTINPRLPHTHLHPPPLSPQSRRPCLFSKQRRPRALRPASINLKRRPRSMAEKAFNLGLNVRLIS